MKKDYMGPNMEVTMLTPMKIMVSSLALKRSGQGEEEIYDEAVLLSRNWTGIWDEEENE